MYGRSSCDGCVILIFVSASIVLINVWDSRFGSESQLHRQLPNSFGLVSSPAHKITNSSHPKTREQTAEAGARLERIGYFGTNGISKDSGDYKVTKTQKGTVTEVLVELPPFHWETPRGLTAETYDLFFKQPENWRHFKDSLTPSFGLVEIHENVKFLGPPKTKCNVTHLINFEKSPVEAFDGEPQYDTVMFLSSHQVDYFQHFLDNGVPHISLMLFATGLDPSTVTFALTGWRTEAIPSLLRRFGFKEVIKANSFSAKKLILAKTVPALHPLFTRHFIDGLRLKDGNGDKIILVSRTQGDGTKRQRLINNQGALVEKLREIYGDRFILFSSKSTPIEKAMDIFANASIIIGSHGGAMYNLMWSPRRVKVVEIMSVQKSGMYNGQRAFNGRMLAAHLAIYTVCLMNGNEFFRYYEVGAPENFDVNVDRFVNWLRENIEIE